MCIKTPEKKYQAKLPNEPPPPMKRTLSASLLLALALVPPASMADTGDMLVSFSTNDSLLAMPTETFAIAANSKGWVSPSDGFHLSGYSAIQIRELPEDGDFAELRATFPERTDGQLLIHFHLLVANPDQELNAVLSGPQFFNLEKDGASLWLKTMRGHLWSWYETAPKKLFKPEPFVWYQFDAIYDGAKGTTLLRVLESTSGTEVVAPVVLRNASGLTASKVSNFSFTGDFRDEESASLFVDDLQIQSGTFESLPAYAAPESRKSFSDAWQEIRKYLRSNLRCIPPRKLADLGIAAVEAPKLRGESLQRIENALFNSDSGAEFERGLPRAISSWKLGCERLRTKDTQGALDDLRIVRENNPDAKTFEISLSLAYAAAGKTSLAEQSLVAFSSGWLDDIRFAAALAAISVQSGKKFDEMSLLTPPSSEMTTAEEKFAFAELLQIDRERGTISRIVEELPAAWSRFEQEVLNREEYFYSLLWNEKYEEAKVFADKLAEAQPYRKSEWLEMAGDACLLLDGYKEAERRYSEAIVVAKNFADARIYGKLADIAWATRDFKAESKLRRKAFRRLAF